MMLPVSEIWEDTMAFVQREWGLLAPVSLALLGLSSVAAELAGKAMGPDGPVGGPAWAVMVFMGSVLLSQFGQLAIMALALTPGQSVGEALGVAARRMPKLIAITLILSFIVVLAALPLAIILVSNGVDLGTTPDRLPFSATLGVFVFMGVLAWMFVRLLPLNALLVDKDPGIGDTLKHSFGMTRGHGTILLGLSALYLLISLITTGAATFVVGSAFGLLGQAAGVPYAGPLMGALAGGMIAAGLGAISNVFLTRVYLKLRG
jgi:hypothetical protein